MSREKRVVVTGFGMVTPIGLDEATFWQSLLSGRAGIDRISAFDTTGYKTKSGAEVADRELSAALDARKWSRTDRVVDMALLASADALEAAGLMDTLSPADTATIIGSGGGPSLSIEEGYDRFAALGLPGIRPTTVVRCMANIISSHISMKFRLTGPNYVVVSACTSSTNAIGIGFRMIRNSYAEHVLCGGAESFFTRGMYGAWDKLGVMSRNPDPAKASRPFDAARDGFVLGEGAAMLVLESLDSAVGRGARIRGEICGYGESSDAEHLTRPSEQGQARAMRAAIEDARLAPGDIGFINAHGTATKANDECESRSIRNVLGVDADRVPVASNKSFFGHLLGAAGAVEAIATLLGLEAGLVPSNINLDTPDPACNLCFVGGKPAEITSPVAMKNSFGFGGNNAVLILRRYDGESG